MLSVHSLQTFSFLSALLSRSHILHFRLGSHSRDHGVCKTGESVFSFYCFSLLIHDKKESIQEVLKLGHKYLMLCTLQHQDGPQTKQELGVLSNKYRKRSIPFVYLASILAFKLKHGLFLNKFSIERSLQATITSAMLSLPRRVVPRFTFHFAQLYFMLPLHFYERNSSAAWHMKVIHMHSVALTLTFVRYKLRRTSRH